MRFLRKIYNYAADGNYVAPGKPWDALPRLVTLSDGQLSAGATPDTPVPAEHENARNKIMSDAHAVQLHAALKQWGVTKINTVGTDTYQSIVGLRITRANVNNESQRQVIAVGKDAAASSKARIARCADGSTCEPTPARLDTIAAFTSPVWGVAGAPGELMLINNTPIFAYSDTSGSTWATGGSYSGPPTLTAVHYSSALGYFLIGNRTCYRSGTLAGLASPSTALLPTPSSNSFAGDQVEFADNGSVVLVAGMTTAGAGSGRVYRSTDGGATWTVCLTFAGGVTDCNVVWSEYYQLFFAWANDGGFGYSSDGSVWGSTRVGLTAANGFLAGRGSLLAVGPALVKPTSYTSVGTQAGIVYSLDQGVTWNYHYFSDGPGSLEVSGLRAINGRVYALGLGSVFRSGLLGAPIAEI